MKYQRPFKTSRNPSWMHATTPEGLVPLTDDPTGLGDRQVALCGLSMVTQGDSAGSRFSEVMLPWQRDTIRYIWGERDENGVRKVKKMVLIGSKGLGKSMFAASLVLGHVADLASRGVCSRMVVIVLAASIASANIIHTHISEAILSDPEMKGQWQGHSGRRELKHKKSGIIIRCTPPEMQAVVGNRVCFLVVDETHEAAKSREFNAVVDQARRGSTVAADEFLEINISTSPIDVATGYYTKTLEQAKKQRDLGGDESLLPLVFTFPLQERPDLDISDSRQWWRSNPSIGHTQSIASIEREFTQAVQSPDPADMSLFMSQRLCIEPDIRKGVGGWVVAEQWSSLPRCGTDMQNMEATKPTIGIDIGGSDDLAAMVMVYMANGRLHVHSRQFCTQQAYDRAHPNARVLYAKAVQSGELSVHPTSSALEVALQMECSKLSATFGSDLWSGGDLYGLAGFAPRFKGATGLEFKPVRQSFNLLASKNRLEALVSDGAVAHEHLPLLAWNLENLRIDESGSGLKLRKADAGASGQGSAKIDGVMALLSALELLEHPDRTVWDIQALIA